LQNTFLVSNQTVPDDEFHKLKTRRTMKEMN
jgi:hypothetical protein